MKLCKCPGLQFDGNGLSGGATGPRHCERCGQHWVDMREPVPDTMGRFIDGSVTIHWRDGYVNLVDVSQDRLIARRYYDLAS